MDRKRLVPEESLGTDYCPNCAIIKEKMQQLEIWEKNLTKREMEFDKEMEFIHAKQLTN